MWKFDPTVAFIAVSSGISSGVDSGYETTAELIFARLLTVVTMHCGCWWSDLLSIRHTKFVNVFAVDYFFLTTVLIDLTFSIVIQA